MATSLTSDIFHEFCCTPCSEEDINKEADVFCANCVEYFCKSCLRGHNRVADGKHHQLLDKDEFRNISTTTNKGLTPDLPTEKCQNHRGKITDMYCENHNEICCSTCVALEHRQCKSIHYIPDIASSRLSQQTIQTVSRNLSDRRDEFTILKQNRKDHKTRIADEKDAYLKSIKGRRKAINEYLDQEEKTLRDTVTDRYKEIKTKLDHAMKTCEESISLVDTMKGKLRISRNNDTSHKFIYLKRAEQVIKDTGIKLSDCQRNRNDQHTIIYEDGLAIEELLSPDTLFGIVRSGYLAPNALNKEEDINIRFNRDKSVCDCRGLCQLADGTIIITDWDNKSLKSLKYDKTYEQSDSLSMSNSPCGICTVNDNEVAVTVTDEKNVSIVAVSPKLTVISLFKVDSRCSGIAYANGSLYVGHPFDSKLTVYDLQGNRLKKFSRDSNGTTLCKGPRRVCINPITQHIIVADKYKGIVMINKKGELVAEYTYKNQKFTYGVCMDDRGNMYTADTGSNQLLVLDMNGTLTTLLDNLIDNPQAIIFDKHRQRLLVTYDKKDAIQSFSLHYNIK